MLSGLKRGFNSFILGNLFIALCATGMVFSTFLMNHSLIRLTPFTVFLTAATYLLYTFHRYSFKLNFHGFAEFKFSLNNLLISPGEKLLFFLAAFLLTISLFFLSTEIYLFLIPLILLAVSYTIPLIKWNNKRIRLLQVPMMKTPAIALVWGISTTLIPLVEQNISIYSSFVALQLISRTLFIFALCIPFEIRDLDSDSNNNVKTLPVRFGINSTKIAGVIIILTEIMLHHLMDGLSSKAILSLDLSSLVALLWIMQEGRQTGVYYYKFLVDGTMLVRFLFLFISIHKL